MSQPVKEVRLVRCAALVMMAAAESKNRAPEGIREYANRVYEEDYSMKFVCCALRYAQNSGLMRVTNGTNIWGNTPLGAKILIEHIEKRPELFEVLSSKQEQFQ